MKFETMETLCITMVMAGWVLWVTSLLFVNMRVTHFIISMLSLVCYGTFLVLWIVLMERYESQEEEV